MPQITVAEIDYFSRLIAALVVSAARTNDREQLSEVYDDLVSALGDVFTLLSDSPWVEPELLEDLTGPLLEQANSRGAAV